MNQHYDEAAKAKSQLVNEDIADNMYVSEAGITDETMQFGALNRIAEATLALAYEQRTANLIAAYRELDSGAHGPTELGYMTDSFALAEAIASRLDLPPRPAPPNDSHWGDEEVNR